MRYGVKIKRNPDMKDHMAVSTGLIHMVFRMTFLRAFMRVLTLMKRAPSSPPRMPIRTAAGITSHEFSY